MRDDELATRTRGTFGLLWRETAKGRVELHGATHFERAASAAGVRPLAPGARVLDAGCGPGRDLVWLATHEGAATAVGLDASDAVQVPAQAVAGLPNACVARGTVLSPPFRAATFDLVYSYGVLHHTGASRDAFDALARLVAPGGQLLVYVYTDLREEPLLRRALTIVTAIRRLTTRLQPRTVLILARVAAPVVFFLFAVPAMLLRRLPGGERLATRLPFSFVTRPRQAVGDLYDRFSAPIEHRHSHDEVLEWFQRAGFHDIAVATMPGARGWVGVGSRGLSAS